MKLVRRFVAATAITTFLALSACTYDGEHTDAPTTSAIIKATTLRIGTNDYSFFPTAPQIERFARQVNNLSGGSLLIEPVWKAAGNDVDDWDQAVARLVVSGELDMAVIPTRAWDTEGVMSFSALNAPFLVTSDEAIKAVVAPEYADGMLSGLDKLGITGLALFPEGPRFLFSFDDPILALSDLAGKSVRSPRSNTTYALFEAFGAIPDDLIGQKFDDSVAAGTVAAAESSFAYAGSLPKRTTATGNLILFPKINSLVINTKALQRLDETQQRTLLEAAASTREITKQIMPVTTIQAKEFCLAGGEIVAATDEKLSGFKEAAAPIYTELERDPATKDLIAKLRVISAKFPGTPINPCTFKTY